jgi:transposase
MLPFVLANVATGSTVSTDTHRTYSSLAKLGYKHGKVNHNIDEWKNGIYCTNTIEGFWSHLKRGIKSTHASVSKQHLQKYVGEFTFRYNNRDEPAEMFARLLKQISA